MKGAFAITNLCFIQKKVFVHIPNNSINNRYCNFRLSQLKSGLIRQFLLNTLEEILTFKLTPVDKLDVNKPLESSFSDAHLQRVAESEGRSSYGYLATLLAEMVCSDVVATLPWPDEEFLKYTVERLEIVPFRFELFYFSGG